MCKMCKIIVQLNQGFRGNIPQLGDHNLEYTSENKPDCKRTVGHSVGFEIHLLLVHTTEGFCHIPTSEFVGMQAVSNVSLCD